ncbi:MAG: YlmC/YmxH family sporulation protein [Coprobacillaceae bacterium]
MRFVTLQSKDVVNVIDGCKIGFISDVEIDWCTKQVCAIVVFCFFKEMPCITIPVECIISVGGDVILVNIDI